MSNEFEFSELSLNGLATMSPRLMLQDHLAKLDEARLFTAAEAARAYSAQLDGIASQASRLLHLAEPGFAKAASAVMMANSEWTRSINDSISRAQDLDELWKRAADSVVDFAKLTESIVAAAPQLDIQTMLDELRASTAISALATGHFATNGILPLTTVPEAVREVVQRHLPQVSSQDTLQPAPAAPSPETAAPTDYAWDAWLKLQPPWVQVFFWLLIRLVLIVLAGVAHTLERWLSSDSHEARTQTVVEIKQTLGPDYVNGLRCVRGTGVKLREGPSKDAPVVGRLSAGRPVEVVETQGSFTHIPYRDPATGEIREGWAASGYLVNVAC